MKTYESLAIGIPEILIPVKGIDLTKWAVIACDQYTSEPEYWEKVEKFVGQSPSTLHLIYPEVYLNAPDKERRISRIQAKMKEYLAGGVFRPVTGMIYVERETAHGWRKGLLFSIDLEKYDYHPGSNSLIRSTEGTILERIPPRVKIREGASLEVPHIMLLIDDESNSVIGPATDHKNSFSKLYDFNLMFDSGHLTGYLIDEPKVEKMILGGLEKLSSPQNFYLRYNLPEDTPLLLFAVGDGNHSLATAKTIWEKIKASSPDPEIIKNSPLRYALVEVVNLYDESLVFEPIHRLLFEVKSPENLEKDLRAFFGEEVEIKQHHSFNELKAEVNSKKKNAQIAGIILKNSFKSIYFKKPVFNLTVATIQNFLDDYLGKKAATGLDYVHGDESLYNLTRKKERSVGFYLPALDKTELFITVILDGALPRKTFSMGEAWEKRFYLEARKLIE